MSFKGEHILSVSQFDRDTIQHVFQIARNMQPYASRQKRTKVLMAPFWVTCFLSPAPVPG